MGSGQADSVSVALPPVQRFLTRDSFTPQGTSGLVWRHLRGHTGRGVLLGTVGRSWDAVSIIKCTRWPPKQWSDPDVNSA